MQGTAGAAVSCFLAILVLSPAGAESLVSHPGRDLPRAAHVKGVVAAGGGITVKRLNVLLNPGLDNGADKPSGWHPYRNGFAWDGAESYDGGKSALLMLDGTRRGLYHLVEGARGETWTASAYVKTVSVSSTSLTMHYMYISVLYKDGTCVDPVKRIGFPRGDADWTRVSGSFECDRHREIEQIRFHAFSSERAGACWIDCMQLEPGKDASGYSNAPYPRTSLYVSPPIRLTNCLRLSAIQWVARSPEGTQILLSTRAAGSEQELLQMEADDNWSVPFRAVGNGQKLAGGSKEFIQYRAAFMVPAGAAAAPVLNSVEFVYSTQRRQVEQ